MEFVDILLRSRFINKGLMLLSRQGTVPLEDLRMEPTGQPGGGNGGDLSKVS